jgi:hypothetical protein
MSAITTHSYGFAFLFLLANAGIGLFFVWIAEKSPARALLQSCAGVVAPYSSLLAVLFGLFAAFLANDVSLHADRAHAAVSREANAIAVVLSVADGLAERGQTLKRLAVEFGQKSAGKEWSSAAATADAERFGLAMLHELLFGGLATVDPQVRQTALAAIGDLRAARSDMSAVAHSQTSWLKWKAVLIFGILTMMGIVVVHLGRPRPMVLAVTLFALGMTFMLWVVLIRLDPYAGKNAVSLAPIRTAYERFVGQ